MAVPEGVGVQEAQEYYDTADRIRIKPGWMQGEGQPMPEIEPYLWRWSQVEPLVMKSGELVTPTAMWNAAPCGWPRRVSTGAPPTPSRRRCNCCCPARTRQPTGTLRRPSAGCSRARAPTPRSRATSATWSRATWF